jgi:C1A family cysteine protease
MENLVTLTEVEAAISTKRLGWQAAETALSAAMASPGRFGLRPANLTERTLQVATVTPHGFRPKRPLKVDWYELGRVSSVKSQGLCGACVAFAICAAMESSLAIADDVETTLDLSEADLFCGCGDCCESGWDFVPALERVTCH